MQPITWAAVAAAWGILLAGAAGVMKTTDLVRSWVETHLPTVKLPSYAWILVPFGVGIATCLTSHLNPLVALFPALPHTYGEVLSGIALGAIASPLHHGTALLSSLSKKADPNDQLGVANLPDGVEPAGPPTDQPPA